MPPAPNPATMLQGLTLAGGWRVVERFERPADATGGLFSVGYRVENDGGRVAFLKALDYSQAFLSPDPAAALQGLTAAYIFERDLLKRCIERKMSRVIRVLDDGTVSVGPQPTDNVQYLIFELAPKDARRICNSQDDFDVAWAMRAMHHAATGLQQLHSVDVAHQDLKPSNLLVFDDRSSKLGDLGCAALRNGGAPRDGLSVAGDFGYAPPELLYGYVSADWNHRRLGCDLYLLGSMLYFFIGGMSVTGVIQAKLHSSHQWDAWGGSYAEVLPFVRVAHAELLAEFRANAPPQLAADLTRILSELCEPSVESRGDPVQRLGSRNPFSIERYVSRFDVLAGRAELALMKGAE